MIIDARKEYSHETSDRKVQSSGQLKHILAVTFREKWID